MKKQYKYKREHFDTQEGYEHFKKVRTEAQKRWIAKHDNDPEFKERRILRQRLYSRYYWHSSRQTFAEWLLEKHGIECIKTIPIERLREIAAVIPGPYGLVRNRMMKEDPSLAEAVSPAVARPLACQ